MRWGTPRRLTTVSATVLSLAWLIAAVAAGPAAAQSQSTLDGETLVALFSKCNVNPFTAPSDNSPCAINPPPAVVQASCDTNGTSTLRYDVTAAGPQIQGSVQVSPSAAAGPYPGIFREAGTITIAPQNQAPVPVDPFGGPYSGVLTGSNGFNTGPLLTWQARFEIESGDSTVVGTKTLTADAPGFGVCSVLNGAGPSPLPQGVNLTGYSSLADAQLSYSATISTPTGVFRDRGTASADLRELFATYPNRHGDQVPTTTAVGADVGLLVEIFKSSLTQAEPASADTCKKGGFLNFGGLDFKNQGDCVSYFATNGSNQPAG